MLQNRSAKWKKNTNISSAHAVQTLVESGLLVLQRIHYAQIIILKEEIKLTLFNLISVHFRDIV